MNTRLRPHHNIPTPIEKTCSFCDMQKATRQRIPACKRPATYVVCDGGGFLLFFCSYHARGEGAPGTRRSPALRYQRRRRR